MPSPIRGAPPMTVADRPPVSKSHATRPVTVLLPLVPLIATPGRPALTSSARSAGRGSMGIPSARAALHSGVSASTAVEYTKRSRPAPIAAPSWGTSAMPAPRSRAAVSSISPWSRARSDPCTRCPRARMSRASGFIPAPATPEKW